MAEPFAVVVEDLVKRYRAPGGGSFAAVDGLSLAVRRGETLALLGPNGAGKTTTLEIVEGLIPRDGGRVRVLGLDPGRDAEAVLERIGIQLQSAAYFERLRLVEILALLGRLYRRRLAPQALLERVGLADKARARVGELSGGQAQRFSIVAALVNDPELLFLDEPSTGLDLRARREVWKLVGELAADGRTVVLTTHYMEEARTLADRVAFVDRGRVVAVDTPEALLARHGAPSAIELLVDGEVALDPLRALPAVLALSAEDTAGPRRRVALAVESVPVALAALLRRAEATGLALAGLRVREPTLEDVFLALTGNALAPHAAAAEVTAATIVMPLVFLSGAFFPVAGLPGWLRETVEVLPLAPLLDALRTLVVDDGRLVDVADALARVLAWLPPAFALAVLCVRGRRYRRPPP